MSKNRRRTWSTAAVVVLSAASSAFALPPLATPPFASDKPAPTVPADDADAHRPRVQIALLLDTSNSMDGLIFQARTQLWTIVNEMSRTKRDGRRPRLEVALYEYGNDRLSPGEGFVRQVVGFTDDLDLISERLWQLTTNGGSEFCGHVIRDGVRELAWDGNPRTYKAIFIAGNEPFTQGQVDYREAVAKAIGKGIVVNTIHCGTRDDGMSGMWADGAKRGEGEFMYIDQDRRRHVPRCPQDEEIGLLNRQLNETYIPYGVRGSAGAARQQAQDAAAASAPAAEAGADVQRAVAKASGYYNNASWDLVDAVRDGGVKLDDLKDADLPEALRDMTPDQRRAHVEQQLARRQELAGRINALNAERAGFLAEHEKREAEAGKETLDSAAIKVVREQLRAKGFETAE
jgi:hypothetical protein